MARRFLFAATLAALAPVHSVLAQQTFDPSVPATIPKYVSELVIPPEMPPSSQQPCSGLDCPATRYNIAVRQFRQQILPAPAPATTVWGYGRAEDALALDPSGAQQPGAASSFSYPAFTVENTAGRSTSVRWINELVSIDPASGRPYPSGSPMRTFLPSLVPVDPTAHWANPARSVCFSSGLRDTDCRPDPGQLPGTVDAAGNPVADAYTGPVPMVVHVHGADDNAQSDGYPEAWWLPDASNLQGYVDDSGKPVHGRQYDQYLRANGMPGSAAYQYENTQPPMTLWYHDHTLGITHNNVYAGESGFWLIRGTYTDPTTRSVVARDLPPGVLPGSASPLARPTNPNISYGALKGCDPNADRRCRLRIREIPLLLQDRTFNRDGSLYYARSRDEANAYGAGSTATVPYAPSSDIAPILNPEYFGNTLLVNGRTWPTLKVARDQYRLRLLAGGDARTFNLSLWVIPPALIAKYGSAAKVPNADIMAPITRGGGIELPFWQIGAEQGFLPKVVMVRSGHRSWVVPGDGRLPKEVPCVKQRFAQDGTQLVAPTYPEDPLCERALLLAPAERADVIVRFNALPAGTVVRMINTGPDEPFGGFPLDPASAPAAGTTDQVMQFEVTAAGPIDPSVDVLNLSLPAEASLQTAGAVVRKVSLVENDSSRVCVVVDLNGAVVSVPFVAPATSMEPISATCAAFGAVPFGPAMTLLGSLDANGFPVTREWADPITQSMQQGQVELWEFYNFTADAHPIHLHGTRMRTVSREALVADAADPELSARPAQIVPGTFRTEEPTEAGYKDTVVVNPREVSRVLVRFDRTGLYTWHCHIVEHEDNEMMLPMCVRGQNSSAGLCVNPATPDGLPSPAPAVPIATGF